MCPALPLLEAPNTAPGIENGVGAVTEAVLASGCKSYTVSCQATEGTPPVGIGGLQDGMPVVLSGPVPGPITSTLLCNEDAEIEGTDTTGNSAILRSVYCVQAEVSELCTTCVLPILPAPEGATFENAMGTQTMDMVGGCTRFTVTCRATAGNPDIAFGVSLFLLTIVWV
uniref:Uncharacterized protein n=1 Tax=Panagrolaimus superbus TaxID=310955 RepID=A0A914Z8F2_9BILA